MKWGKLKKIGIVSSVVMVLLLIPALPSSLASKEDNIVYLTFDDSISRYSDGKKIFRRDKDNEHMYTRQDPSKKFRHMGPYTHKIYSASSKDGLIWIKDPGVRVEHASVPCAVSVRNKIFLYYVDADRGPGKVESIGCAISEDGINFSKQPFYIEGLPTDKAVDPSIVYDTSGKFLLYYFASSPPADPAMDTGLHEIYLAVSDDGIFFKNLGVAFSSPSLVDPDVFFYKGTWFMYVFGRGNTVIATSNDYRNFTYKQSLNLKGYGTVAPVLLEDGRLRLYAFEQFSPPHKGNAIRSFISGDGINWEMEPGIRLQADNGKQITDPFVIRWKGGYKMYFKVEDRQGKAE